jgi:hypothetical protein
MIALLTAAVFASPGLKESRDVCVACDPAGVKTTAPPQLGKDDMARFYEDLLRSVSGIHFSRRGFLGQSERLQGRSDTATICCKCCVASDSIVRN